MSLVAMVQSVRALRGGMAGGVAGNFDITIGDSGHHVNISDAPCAPGSTPGRVSYDAEAPTGERTFQFNNAVKQATWSQITNHVTQIARANAGMTPTTSAEELLEWLTIPFRSANVPADRITCWYGDYIWQPSS